MTNLSNLSAVPGIAVLALSASVLASVLLLSGASPAQAQQQAAQQQAAQRQAAPAQQAAPLTGVAAGDALKRIGVSGGIPVLADSTVAQERIPENSVQGSSVEQQIAAVVQRLPKGTTWAKLYLPAPAKGEFDADDVSAYAQAQARLFGRVGSTEPGSVEVMGKQLPEAAAQDMIAKLNLQPMYLVTNPQTNQSAGSGVSLQAWNQMTGEQRQQFAQKRATEMLSADPNVRQQMMRDMMRNRTRTPEEMIMRQMMRQMPREQRGQLFEGMRRNRDRGGAGGGGAAGA